MQAKKITKLGQGAEAVVYRAEAPHTKEITVVKERIRKNYRIPEIDNSLRRQRTRRESKVLEKLKEIGMASPYLVVMDDESMVVEMEYIDGPKLRDVLHKNRTEFSREVGKKIALMHNAGIIHGDLTTSNMVLDKKDNIHFIDFGLSFFSNKVEDKAVDLHLARQALESRHYEIFDECFKELLKGYKEEAKEAGLTIKRLEVVEARGRNKEKA